jgi:hypothetical protein
LQYVLASTTPGKISKGKYGWIGASCSVCFRPVVAEVGIREILRPPGQDPGQGGSLPASRRKVPFQDKYQGNVALRSKVRYVLGNDRPAFHPGGCGDLRIISCP